MKKIIMAVIASIVIAGCCYNPNKQSYYDDGNTTTNVIMQTEFNDEMYVWENFIFSTNRVDKTK